MTFRVVIPARYESSRLPGKVLREIAGRPMLAHVHQRALESGADAVWVATDDPRVFDAAQAFGAHAAMTDSAHQSGTDRLAELAEREGWPDEAIVVNLQGDEPLMPGLLIGQVAAALASDPAADMATAATPLADQAEYLNTNAVKLVVDDAGYALYFSRAPIPHARDERSAVPAPARRHLGLYAYRVAALRHFSAARPSPLERCESLEQLRALGLGLRIRVVEAQALPGPGVDTPEDLQAVTQALTAHAQEQSR